MTSVLLSIALLIDTRDLISSLLRTDKLQFSVSVASRYLLLTAHHSLHIADLRRDMLLA